MHGDPNKSCSWDPGLRRWPLGAHDDSGGAEGWPALRHTLETQPADLGHYWMQQLSRNGGVKGGPQVSGEESEWHPLLRWK